MSIALMNEIRELREKLELALARIEGLERLAEKREVLSLKQKNAQAN